MKKYQLKSIIVCLFAVCALSACKGKTDSAPKAEAPKAEAPKADAPKAEAPKADAPKADAPIAKSGVFFVSPKNGDTVKSPLKVVFGLSGKTIRPAGEDAMDKTSGHHHLIVDGAGIAAGQVVPMDKTHIHFGKGQTETTIELSSGKHTLTMQFADGAHLSYGKEWSTTVEVVVE